MKFLIAFLMFALVGGVWATEEEMVEKTPEEIAAGAASGEMTLMVSTYLKTAVQMVVVGEGKMSPFFSFITDTGEMGYKTYDVPPTDDLDIIQKVVATMYHDINERKEELSSFAIFSVAEAESEGDTMIGVTVIMEHESGAAAQRYWPLLLNGSKAELLRVKAVPAKSVVYGSSVE